MKFSLLLLCLYLSVRPAYGQDSQVMQAALKEQRFREAINLAKSRLQEHPGDVLATHVLGRAYHHLKPDSPYRYYYDSSNYYLLQALALDKERTWVSHWSAYYLAENYFIQGKNASCREMMLKALRLNKTETASFSTKRLAQRSNLGDFFDNWVTIQSEHFIFHFQDTAAIRSMARFINSHEDAFVRNNKIFQAQLPKKIDYYVWSDATAARRILGAPLGFTVPDLALCNVRTNQTVGHELTHVLSHWGWGLPVQHKSRLINEGVAVCFDGGVRDKDELAATVLKGQPYKSILEIWNNDAEIPEEILYPVAGAFLGWLHHMLSPEEFRSLIKNQTPAQLQQLAGDRYAQLIADFNALIGFR